MRKSISVFVLLSMFAMLSACATKYDYAPPRTAQGQACVTQCQAKRDACIASVDSAASARKAVCVQKSHADYVACLKYARTDIDRALCREDTCYVSSDDSACHGTFRACYRECGGSVKEAK